MDLKTTMGSLSGNTSQDLKMLYNYVFQLTEEMRYLMNNLDVTNFNDLGLARYENGRLQVYSEVVEVRANKVESIVEALGNDLGEFESSTEEAHTHHFLVQQQHDFHHRKPRRFQKVVGYQPPAVPQILQSPCPEVFLLHQSLYIA